MGRASVVMRLDSMGDVPGGAFQGDRITRYPIPAAN